MRKAAAVKADANATFMQRISVGTAAVNHGREVLPQTACKVPNLIALESAGVVLIDQVEELAKLRGGMCHRLSNHCRPTIQIAGARSRPITAIRPHTSLNHCQAPGQIAVAAAVPITAAAAIQMIGWEHRWWCQQNTSLPA